MGKSSSKSTQPKMPRKSGETMELGLAKLASSGLTTEDAQHLGMHFLDPIETQSLHKNFKPVPSLKIPYFDPFDPQKPLTGWPKWPQFYRLRYLKTPSDFASLANKKPPRYVQEPDSGVCSYFPHLPNINWKEILNDTWQPLIITEGEFKAAKACKEGFPTIGLGGVYNFKSAKLGISFLQELERVNWIKRYVYIAYDSDFRSNPMVCSALNELAEELRQRGAIPNLVPLPDVVENAKTGLDDFLIARPADELGSLMRDGSYPLTLAQSLWRLNDQVTYVYNPGLVIMHETGQKISPSQFKDHAFSTADYVEQVVKDNGNISLRPASAAQAWLKWPMRREVGKLTYAPGRDQVIPAGSVMTSMYNTWPGWGVEPKKGDVAPFLRLIDHLFTGADPEAKKWFINWCAYPLQFPGTKMFSSAAIHGIKHGTGKSLIGYSLGRIYGRNFTEIKQTDLHAGFNEWAENRQFVLGDDVTGSDRRADADMLKKLITQRELRLNPKYVPSYVVPDCINYLWTSNQPDAFFLEDDDRRFFIHEVMVGPLSEEFYVDYDIWLDTGGSAAIFHYLLNIDTSDFNPAAPAMRTAAKDRMTADVRSDLGSWVRMLIQNPDAVLRIGDIPMKGDLFTNRQLLKIYDPEQRTRTTANGLGRELRRAGVPQVLDGKPIKTEDGQDRFYVLRNREKWVRATFDQVRTYLAEDAKPKRKKKF